jgi:hypothetical protein
VAAVYTPVAPVPVAAPPPQAYIPPPTPGFAAAPPPPPPSPYLPAAPVPMGGMPAAPVKQGGSSAVKIILIVVAIFVGLGLLGAGAVGFMVWRVSRAFHVSHNGDMSVSAPGGGSFSLNQSKSYSAAELGTDIYPGADPTQGGMKMDLPTASVVTGVFVTSDSKQKVVDFYKDKFGSDATVFDSDSSAVISLKRSDKETVMVTVESNSSQNGGKTKFSIMHSKSKSS